MRNIVVIVALVVIFAALIYVGYRRVTSLVEFDFKVNSLRSNPAPDRVGLEWWLDVTGLLENKSGLNATILNPKIKLFYKGNKIAETFVEGGKSLYIRPKMTTEFNTKVKLDLNLRLVAELARNYITRTPFAIQYEFCGKWWFLNIEFKDSIDI